MTTRLRKTLLRLHRPIVICTACELKGGPFARAEATYLIALHDELHHGGPGPRELSSRRPQ